MLATSDNDGEEDIEETEDVAAFELECTEVRGYSAPNYANVGFDAGFREITLE